MSTVSSSAKGDYSSPLFRGALMRDHFHLNDERVASGVIDSFVADVGRASSAIQTLARLVHNSLSEPHISGAEPLGNSACTGLLCAMEIVGSHLGDLTDNMNDYRVEVARSSAESTTCDEDVMEIDGDEQ